jgi:hypothetical protein
MNNQLTVRPCHHWTTQKMLASCIFWRKFEHACRNCARHFQLYAQCCQCPDMKCVHGSQSVICLNYSYRSQEAQPNKVAQVLTFLDFIRVVPSSNMGLNTDHPHKVSWFFSVLPDMLLYSTCHFSTHFINFSVGELFISITYAIFLTHVHLNLSDDVDMV